MGGGTDVGVESNGDMRRRSSSNLRDMDCIISPRDNWWLVSLRMASSSLFEDPLALKASAITMTTPKLIGK